MNKKMIVMNFGLVVLALSLFTSAAFASTATAINVKNVDEPGRRPFQTLGAVNVYATAGSLTYRSIITVPDNQRLVVKQVSGMCHTISGLGAYVALSANAPGQDDKGLQFLGKEFTTDFTPANGSVEFFADPGDDFGIKIFNASGQDGMCFVTVSGYFVNLP